MLTYQGKKGIYQLPDKPFASGGEGAIYKVSRKPDAVAKLYTNPTAELEQKLSYMASNPPVASVLNAIAWPLDILYDQGGKFVGFIMPKMSTDSDLKRLYPYNVRTAPLLNYQQRVIVAINICIVISAVHAAGYTFGDFNPLNIGVNLTDGHVGFFDTDSYHITDRTNGNTYRCAVAMDGYVAPELIKACKGSSYLAAPLPTFTQQTDLFALAIHIFKLLMNGYTPFNGIKENANASTASPGQGNQAIERGNYCFKPGKKPQSAATPELSAFPEKIRNLFTRAFIDGEKDPYARPNAEEWKSALAEYMGHLKVCRLDPSHYYSPANTKCPYCEAKDRYLAVMGGQKQLLFSAPVVVPSGPTAVKKPATRTRASSGGGTRKKATNIGSTTKSANASGSSSSSASSGSSSSSSNSGISSPHHSTPNPDNYQSPPSYNQTTVYAPASGSSSSSKKKIIRIVVIVAAVLFLITILPTIIQKCGTAVRDAKYSDSHFSVSITDKSYGVIKFRIDNSSSEAISGIYGNMRILNLDRKTLHTSSVTLTGSVSGKSYNEWSLTMNNATEELVETPYEELIVYFRITAVSFEDGTYKKYTDNKEKEIYKGSGIVKKTNSIVLPNLKNIYPGNTVFLGRTEQDDQITNGKEQIEWIVLDVVNGKALLLSKYILDWKEYAENTGWSEYEWENCSLRQYLNGDFYNKCFAEEEKAFISVKEVKPPEGGDVYFTLGNTTYDRLYLLDLDEYDRYCNSRDLSTEQTAYAKRMCDEQAQTYWPDKTSWWLRYRMKRNDDMYVYVSSSGEGLEKERPYRYAGVRPAMWIELP